MKRMTVIGSGANGLATCAYLTMKGFDVTLCDTQEQLDSAAAFCRKGIRLSGAVASDGCAIRIGHVTSDFGKAVEGADCIVVCVSVERHAMAAEGIGPRLAEGQTVLYNPGNLGAVVLMNRYPALRDVPGLVLAELSGCIWACRITGENEVTIALPVGPKRVAAWPSDRTEEAVRRLAPFIPVSPATNVIEAAVNSPNVITHLAGTVFNVARVEKKGEDFAFFRHGMSETVVSMFTKLERERNAVLERAGLRIYDPSSERFMLTLMDETSAPQLDTFRSLKGPSSMKHRYMAEDALCGVPLLISLARHYGIPVPLTESFLTIASAINDRNYYEEGYTLANLGLEPMVSA